MRDCRGTTMGIGPARPTTVGVHLVEFMGLRLRWRHVIADIAWIGSSFCFIWLDHSLGAPPPVEEGSVVFNQGRAFLGERSITCHASPPTFPGILQELAGVRFAPPAIIAQRVQRICQKVGLPPIMP